MSIICNGTASRKSQTTRFPLREPVISWKLLWGLIVAQVTTSCLEVCGRDNVDTTWPVVTEWILIDDPVKEKK